MEQKNRIDGKSSSLTDSRFERLQAVGFRWAKRKGQASWDEKFVSLHMLVSALALHLSTQPTLIRLQPLS